MLTQLHHQFNENHTEMCTQREINNYDELRSFVEDTKRSHPLPKNAKWLFVTEKSKYFMWTKEN